MTHDKKRILILTPWAPYPTTGACQQDRFWGMKLLRDMGHDIRVIGRYHHFQNREELQNVFQKEGINMTLVPHRTDAWKILLQKPYLPFLNPAWLDGSALEFADDTYVKTVTTMIDDFRPEVGWLEYCSHWPMADIFHAKNIPVILKSSNNEAAQCMDDHDRSLVSILKAIPKYGSEWMVSRKSDMVLAVSPDEERWYKRLGARKADTLPLRGLSQCLEKRIHTSKDVLDVVFLTSNYSMGHNRAIVEFVLTNIIPAVQRAMPGAYRFHLTGRKFPQELERHLGPDVISTGFVPDIGNFLRTMDIALSPWTIGQGMQQKVFEPLCRSLPTITTKTGGYDFVPGTEVVFCTTIEEYIDAFKRLRSVDERNRIASAGYEKARSLFSEESVKNIMQSAIESVV